MSDAIDVFDISRLGDAGCDEIWVRIEDLKPLLSRAGLALVPAADVPTPEERAGIEEANRRLLTMIENLEADEDGVTDNDLLLADLDVIRSKLARRAAKEAKGG